jgi:predicted amidohydrolase YtcJ
LRVSGADAGAFVLEGEVVTMDAAAPRAEAVGVRGGRIVAVGNSAEVRRAMGRDVAPVALDGGAVLPGFIDAHHHFCFAAFDRRTPDLHHEPDTPLEALLSQVREMAGEGSRGWVRAQGYDPSKLREKRPPRLEELDEACPERPLFLWAFSAHEACLNSAAFAAMGWSTRTPDPDGGAIVRDRRGRLTGEVVEAACFLAEARSRESLVEGADDAWLADAEAHGEDLLRRGITRVGDPGVPPSLERLYLRAAREQRLPLAVHRMPVGAASLLTPRFDDEPTGSGPAATPVGPAKLFLDGAERCALCVSVRQVMRAASATIRRAVGRGGIATVRAASRRAGFRRGPDGLLHQGILFWEQDALESAVRAAADRGFQVAQHAIGNEAIASGLTAIERASPALDRVPGRPRLEHAMLVDPPLVRRIADAGAIAVVQPFFLYDLGDTLAALPPPKPIELMPLRGMLDAGATLAGSSDYPVSHFDVLAAVKSAATRRTRRGNAHEPDQAISIEEALRAYTLGSAMALGVDQEVGTISRGKHADLVVLSENPLDVDPERVDEIAVLGTYCGGRLAFSAGQADAVRRSHQLSV